MIDVADRAHVDVRLGAFKFACCHFSISKIKSVASDTFKVFAHRTRHWQRCIVAKDQLNYFPRAVMIASATFFGASL